VALRPHRTLGQLIPEAFLATAGPPDGGDFNPAGAPEFGFRPFSWRIQEITERNFGEQVTNT
jgi:hypothetical protein